jgi:D-hexose-6-phosphate mutarotase
MKRFFEYEEDIRQYIKVKDKVYHTKKIKNDLTNFPDYLHICSYLYDECRHEVWHEDYLVDVITTHNYFADSDVEKMYVEGLGEVTSDEEIIVVFMKLKK